MLSYDIKGYSEVAKKFFLIYEQLFSGVQSFNINGFFERTFKKRHDLKKQIINTCIDKSVLGGRKYSCHQRHCNIWPLAGNWQMTPEFLIIIHHIQGDPSRCAKPPVDFKTKVLYWTGLARQKRNIYFEVNGRFCTT